MRILFIKLSSLGDIFHALPTAHELKRHLQCPLDWVVQSEYTDLVRGFPDVDRVIPFPRRGSCMALAGFCGELRSRQYDLAVDAQGLLKSAWICRLARARRKIGPSFHREGSRIFYSEVAGPRRMDRHAVTQNLDLIRHLGFAPGSPCFPVQFPPVAVEASSGPRVALLPCTRWPTKDWPVGSYAELARTLRDSVGATVFLLGGEGDKAVCDGIAADGGDKVVSLAGQQTLAQLAGFLQSVDLVVGGDSGPAHMAAAVGTPVLALFGPTDPGRTAPYGTQHRVLRCDLPCSPCLSRKCRPGHHACMKKLTPTDVAHAALDMLQVDPV